MKCLEVDPKKRASCVELMGDPWILKNLNSKASIKKWLEYVSTNVISAIK
jgi:hypothetical protein